MGTLRVQQTESPVAPGAAGYTSLSFPATATNQLKWVDYDGGTNIINGGGFTLTVPATGTVALLATANAFTAAQTITVGNTTGFNSSSSAASSSTSGGGLIASAAVVPSAADHRLGLYTFAAYTTGTSYNYAARISAFSSQAWSAVAAGSYLVFQTTRDSTTSVAERMRISGGGIVSVGTSLSTLGQFTVSQPSASGAIPPLFLGQAHVTEDMIEFDCTIGVGNAIEAVGAKTLTTTHFIKVTLTGGLTRYLPVGTIA